MPSRKIIINNGPYQILDNNPTSWTNRILIGTPTTGNIRMEWVGARFGQTIPTNWSHVEVWQMMSSYIPLNYQVADAENLIAKTVVEKNFEWLLFIEHDNILPPDTFIKMNEYMIEKKVPVVSGLYFTKSIPPEPLMYRDIGKGHFADWKLGDKVWVSGIPFGCTLIHGDIIRAMWEESEEYVVNGQKTRRVFRAPNAGWHDETGSYVTSSGTSDLEWCNRVMKEKFFEKAGWPEYQKKKYPFLVDTSIFVKHIDNSGTMWPVTLPIKFKPNGRARNIKN